MLNNFSPREGKPKRGRGGTRGSYKPRRQCKSTHGSSSSNYSPNSSYSSNSSSQTQKVCINPEVLRRFGYQVSSPSNF